MAKKEDQRAFFKLDVGYLTNPKIALLLDDSPRAVLFHLECIAYSAQHLTDGIVPIRLAMRIASAEQCDVDACVSAGLVRRVNDTHVEVHDYLRHQRSAESVKGASEQARRAAEARWSGVETNAVSIAAGSADPNAKREEREINLRRGSANADRPDTERLCEHLADRIESNGSKRPTITTRWRDAARLLIDKDGRTEDQIHRAIDWCQDDEFWRANVMSMPKLREKYDTLRLRAHEDQPTNDGEQRSGHTNGWVGQAPMPLVPRELVDDSDGFQAWLADWNAGRPVVDGDGNTVTKGGSR